MCNGTNHNLVEIYRDGYADDINTVVRWCKDCGAVVVDSDYDGRTMPGHNSPMRFPNMLYKNK
jgi:hypothetical protein